MAEVEAHDRNKNATLGESQDAPGTYRRSLSVRLMVAAPATTPHLAPESDDPVTSAHPVSGIGTPSMLALGLMPTACRIVGAMS